MSRDGKLHTEIESVYYADKKDIVEVSKRYSVEPGDNQPVSVAYKFEHLSKQIGWDWYGAGKVMGLAQYKGCKNKLDKEWLKHFDQCSEVQRTTQEEVISLIEKSVQKYETKNIVLSGGYGLNCVANYWYLDQLKDEDINFYVEPVSNDAGTAMGAAFLAHYSLTKDTKVRPYGENLCLGPEVMQSTEDIIKIAEKYGATGVYEKQYWMNR